MWHCFGDILGFNPWVATEKGGANWWVTEHRMLLRSCNVALAKKMFCGAANGQ